VDLAESEVARGWGVIVADDFAIGHIGRTGGDAAKALFLACGVEFDKRLGSPSNPAKHKTFTEAGIVRPVFGLTIRKLPYREMSYRAMVCKAASSEHMIKLHEGETILSRFCESGVTVFLRSENLKDDIANFLVIQRGGTRAEYLKKMEGVATKGYVGNAHYKPIEFFGERGIKRLYDASPTWAKVELGVYGELVG
jgi:hypothetical protein